MRLAIVLLLTCAVTGCERMERVGRAPDFTPLEGGQPYSALYSIPLPERVEARNPGDDASLWAAGQKSLLGDRRASQRGDILTVVIAIDDAAVMSNSSARNRTAAESMGIPALFGLPQRVDAQMPAGASLAEAVGATSSGAFRGNGTVQRNERMTLRLAATVVETLPNGVLRIEGTQEILVNNELRELFVSGFVRPGDISRRNEVSYDKIAGARAVYGGRGLISDAQRPRWGQEVGDILLPF